MSLRQDRGARAANNARGPLRQPRVPFISRPSYPIGPIASLKLGQARRTNLIPRFAVVWWRQTWGQWNGDRRWGRWNGYRRWGRWERLPALGTMERLPTLGTMERLPALETMERLPTLGTMERLPALGTLEQLRTWVAKRLRPPARWRWALVLEPERPDWRLPSLQSRGISPGQPPASHRLPPSHELGARPRPEPSPLYLGRIRPGLKRPRVQSVTGNGSLSWPATRLGYVATVRKNTRIA